MDKKISVYFLVFLFVLVLLMFLAEVSAKCDMTYEDLDKCAKSSSMFDGKNFKIPHNEDELTAVCGDIKKSFQCIGTYVKTCMTPFAQTIFGQFQAAAKKDYKDRCVDPSGRKIFLEHISCAKDSERHQVIYDCVHGYIGQINHQINLHAHMSKEDRVQTSCCSVTQLHECLLSSIKKYCPNSLSYWSSKIIMTEHLESTCGEFQSIQYCDANANPKFWNELKKVFISPENERVEIKYNSPITALIVYMSQKD